MRTIFIFLLGLCAQTLFSQNLVGIWKGSYTYMHSTIVVPISLKIELNTDSSLTVHSYTLIKNSFEKDSILICNMKILKNKGYFLTLREIDTTNSMKKGLQKLSLKYRNKDSFEYLEGKWVALEKIGDTSIGSAAPKETLVSGSIQFVKLHEN